ncbi:MAG: YbjN domain-containing protein [Bauldia sp.]
MSLIDFQEERQTNPVDAIEQIAALNDWTFERAGDDEITISVGGGWADYHVSFSWMEEREAIHLACAFDLKIPEARKLEVMRLLAAVNEQLWIGHFDLWSAEGMVMYRQALLLSGGAEPNAAQVERLLLTAIEACERYFQAFQFVVWAGKTASQALETVLFETAGEA